MKERERRKSGGRRWRGEWGDKAVTAAAMLVVMATAAESR